MRSNIEKKIKKILKNLKFKTVNLSFSKQLVLLGAIVGFISLILPWVQDTDNGITWNSFNSISGNIGYLLVIILAFTLFISFSTNYKEKLKLYSDLSVQNHFIVITSGIFIISFSIIELNFISGLTIFSENIIYGKGLILSMTSGIIVLIGGLIIRKEYYSDDSEIILNKFNQEKEKNKVKNNMKLPF